MQRYAFVASILMILGIAILGKALYIMTVQKSYWMAVSERFVKENQEVLPTRGNILAADGQVLPPRCLSINSLWTLCRGKRTPCDAPRTSTVATRCSPTKLTA